MMFRSEMNRVFTHGDFMRRCSLMLDAKFSRHPRAERWFWPFTLIVQAALSPKRLTRQGETRALQTRIMFQKVFKK